MTSPKYVRQAKRSLTKAFQAKVSGLGFSLVELVSSCPTWWHMKPLEALKWIEEVMLEQYPLKVFVDKLEAGE